MYRLGLFDAEAHGERELARAVDQGRGGEGEDGAPPGTRAIAHEGMQQLQPRGVHALDLVRGDRHGLVVFQVRKQGLLQLTDMFDAQIGLER